MTTKRQREDKINLAKRWSDYKIEYKPFVWWLNHKSSVVYVRLTLTTSQADYTTLQEPPP